MRGSSSGSHLAFTGLIAAGLALRGVQIIAVATPVFSALRLARARGTAKTLKVLGVLLGLDLAVLAIVTLSLGVAEIDALDTQAFTGAGGTLALHVLCLLIAITLLIGARRIRRSAP